MSRESTCEQIPCPGMETKVEFLRQADHYPDRPQRVETIETHASWLFLTDHYVYKLKKPLRYEFLDFSTVAARRRNCYEEVRLNRRLSRNVYLGVVTLTLHPSGEMQLNGNGQVIDWLVKMRRLPSDQVLEQRIKDHTVRKEDIVTVARVLARFYEQAAPVDITISAYLERLSKDLDATLRELTVAEFGLTANRITDIANAQLRFLKGEIALFAQRIQTGRIVEAHGDLRPEHIYLGEEPVIIDCLEFNRELRILDCADELAFLAMECQRLDAPFVGEIVFSTYKQLSSDDPADRLLHFYMSYRAFLWAKLAIWHIRRPATAGRSRWITRTNTYIDLAQAHIQKAQ